MASSLYFKKNSFWFLKRNVLETELSTLYNGIEEFKGKYTWIAYLTEIKKSFRISVKNQNQLYVNVQNLFFQSKWHFKVHRNSAEFILKSNVWFW